MKCQNRKCLQEIDEEDPPVGAVVGKDLLGNIIYVLCVECAIKQGQRTVYKALRRKICSDECIKIP